MEASGKRSRDNASASADAAHHPWPSQDSRIYRVSRGSGGKDRHSKVYTAKGLRDRRIRLAVPTAVQFYDLQDRLGLEQPSKAVDWLMDAAANAIADLPSLDSLFPNMEGGHGHGHSHDNIHQPNQQMSKSKSCSSNSETSKGSVMSLAGSKSRIEARKDPVITTFTEFLTGENCTNDRMMPRSTAADYFRGPAAAAGASDHNLSFLQDDYTFSSFPVTGLNGGTLQSNAAVSQVPRCHHLQRQGTTVDRMGMPFFWAPADNGPESRVPDGMQMFYGDGFRQWEMKGREQS